MKSLSKITSHSSIPCLKKHFSRAYTNSCLHTALLSTTKNSISKDTGSRNLMQMNQRLLTTGLTKSTMQCTILLNTTKSVMLKSALSFQAVWIPAILLQNILERRLPKRSRLREIVGKVVARNKIGRSVVKGFIFGNCRSAAPFHRGLSEGGRRKIF